MKNLSTLLLSTALLASPIAQAETPLWQTPGFEQAESILAHPEKPEMYVSNIQGHPLEADGKGYISLITPAGDIVEKQWVDGLDAPKGMAVSDGLLYVADLSKLRIIDIEKGALAQSIEVHGSAMLNDIAIDKKGRIYISDLIGGGVYRFANNKIELWKTKEEFPHPNGLYFDKNKLIVATWGEGIKEDFSTDVLGSLYKVSTRSGKSTLLEGAEEFGNLDGIVRIGDKLIVNDWINGNVFAYDNKELSLLFTLDKTSADIGANGDELLVPVMFGDRIESYKIQ